MPRLAGLGFQIGFQQALCPVLGAGIPQKIRGHRLAGGYPVLSVQKDRVGRDGKPPVGVQIKLHHRLQRDLVQQQPVGVHDVDPVAQFRQHIAAKSGGVRAGKEQTAPAKGIQYRQHPAAFLPLHPPEGGFAQQVGIVQPLHPAECRGTAQLHAALAALHLQADDRQPLFKGIAAHNALGGVKFYKGIQPLAGQRQTARRAFLPAGAHGALGFKRLPGAHLTAQQPQQLLCIRSKGIPPVHKGQRFPVADAFAPLDRIQKLRNAFYQILPPADAVRDPQPQPDAAIVRRKLRFQQGKAGALGSVLGLGLRILPLVALQQQLGLIVGLRLLAPPLAAEQHIQPGAVTVLAGLRVQPGNAPLHPGDALRLFFRGGRVLFRVLQQQRANVLTVGAVAVLVIGAVAGGADKAAVFPQPDLRIIAVRSAALHQRCQVPHPVLVGGAAALQDALAVLLRPLKDRLAQQCADLLCVHVVSLPCAVAVPVYSIRIPRSTPGCKGRRVKNV